MRQFGQIRRGLAIVVMVACAVLVAGCGKQRTQFSLNKAKDLQEKIRIYEGETYEPARFKSLTETINAADGAMQRADYAASVPRAKEAVQMARTLREDVRRKHSTTLRDRSRQDMAVVRANDGPTLNAQTYTEIDTKLQLLETKYTEEKHDEVIALANEIRNKTNEMLERMRQDAERGSRDVATLIDDMKRELVPQYASSYITDVEKLLEEIKTLVTPDRNYKLALARIKDAMEKAALGIKEARKARSVEKLKKVEYGLTEAKQLGAGSPYVPELERQCSERYAALTEKHFNEEYVVVLENVDMLQQSVDQLIIETKKAAAEDYIGRVDTQLIKLVDGKAQDYKEIADSVVEVKAMLKDARGKFDVASYDEAKAICVTALGKAENIKQRFDGLAQDHIRAAEAASEEARKVFSRAQEEGFFIPKPDGKVEDIDLPFERSKKTLYEQIQSSMNSVQRNIEVAQTRRGEELYHAAIVIADAAQKSSQENVREVMHVGAHNALVELADRTRHFDQDGAGEYATRDIRRVQAELNQIREIISQGQYREAIDKAADTRASLENTVVQLHDVTNKLLNAAKEQYEKAEQEGVVTAKPGKAMMADGLIKKASEGLGVSPPLPLESNKIVYKSTIEQIKEAAGLIDSMRTEKSAEDAQEAIVQAETAIGKAEAAGAEVFAAAMLSDARARHAQAQTLEKEASHVEAALMARQAERLALDALYTHVLEADEAIANARFYQGMKYSDAALAQAIINAKEARIALGEGRYEVSHDLAKRAAEQARAITAFSREKDFRLRAAELKTILTASIRSGAGFFQPTELREMIEELYSLDETFVPGKYDDYNEKLAKLQGRIEAAVNDTPAAMEKVVQGHLNYLEEMEKLGAGEIAAYQISTARWALNQAVMDYRAQRYAKSYEAMRKGVRLTQAVYEAMGAENFRQDSADLLEELNQTMYAFRGFLDLNPNQLKPLVSGYHPEGRIISVTGTRPNITYLYESGIQKELAREIQIDASEFSEQVETLYSRAMAIRAPESQKHLQRKLVEAFREARLAGKLFQKFEIIERFSQDARFEIIDGAYAHIAKSRAAQQYLRDRFLRPEERRVDVFQPMLDRNLPMR